MWTLGILRQLPAKTVAALLNEDQSDSFKVFWQVAISYLRAEQYLHQAEGM